MEMNFEVNMNEYLPLRDVVFNTLRQAILRGELKPGERLMEIQLANKLGVSRTPISPGTGQADVPEMRQVPVPRGRGHVRQVPGAPCVAILFSLRRAAAEGLAGRVVRPMPAAPFGEGEDMNPMDVALEALYVLGVVLCCALLSREEGSREGLGSRRACLFMLALAVEAMQAGLGSLAFREPWGAPFAPWQAFDLTGAVLADLFLAWALLRGGGAPGPDYR